MFKRSLVLVVMILSLVFAMPAFAINWDTGGDTNINTNTNKNENFNTNMNVNSVKNDISNTNMNVNSVKNDVRNTNTQGQFQTQGQSQEVKNSGNNIGNSVSFSGASAGNNTNDVSVGNVSGNTIEKGAVKNTNTGNKIESGAVSVQFNEARQSLNAPEINPYYLAPLQGGKIGDCTKSMPRYAHPALVKLNYDTDVVLKILDVYFGNPFNRITYEEIEAYVLDKGSKYDGSKGNIRYTVKWQDSVITSGMGGGGAISGTSDSGLTSTSGAILPGATKSTANPIFIVTFYEVQVAQPVIKPVVKPEEPMVEPMMMKKQAEAAPSVVVLQLEDIHFANGSEKLNVNAKAILDKNIQLMKASPKVPVRIEGYTSQIGSDAYNQKLSEKRAEVVKEYLVKEGKVPASNLSTIGYGKTKSAYEANPKNVNSKVAKENRKVLFTVISK